MSLRLSIVRISYSVSHGYSVPTEGTVWNVAKNAREWDPFNEEFCGKNVYVFRQHYLTILAPRLYLVFWSLTLQDVYVPSISYRSYISSLEATPLQRTKSTLHDKRGRGILRNCGTIDLLKAELKTRRDQHEFVHRELRDNRAAILGSVTDVHRQTLPEAMLQFCVVPRVTESPEDALFTALFLQELHSIELPKFSTLLYFDRIMKDVIPLVMCYGQRGKISGDIHKMHIRIPIAMAM